MQVNGLYGHIQRNNFKAVALLGAFLGLFLVMQAALRIIPKMSETTTYGDVERLQKRIDRRAAAKTGTETVSSQISGALVPSFGDIEAALGPKVGQRAPVSATLKTREVPQLSPEERRQQAIERAKKKEKAPFLLRLSTVLSATQFFDVQVKSLLLFALIYIAFATWANSVFIRYALRARPLDRKELPELYSLVENLAINAGIPCPAIELVESTSLNAYASGLTPKQARLGLTTGLVEALDRDELEAVIAHELTHIVQRDSRLMAVTKACTDLVLLATVRRVMRKNKFACGMFGLSVFPVVGPKALFILGLVGAAVTVFTYVIKALVLHAREFVADAGAIELTKNPAALISALRKISRNDIVSPNNLATQAMMFSGGSEGWLSTHPAVEDRIAAIERFGMVGGHDVLAHRRRNVQSLGLTSLAKLPPAAAGPAMAAVGAAQRPTFGRRPPAASAGASLEMSPGLPPRAARVLGLAKASMRDAASGDASGLRPQLSGDLMAQATPQRVYGQQKISLPEGLASAASAHDGDTHAKWYEKIILSGAIEKGASNFINAIFLPTKIAIVFSIAVMIVMLVVMPIARLIF